LEELYLERNRLVAVPESWSRLANLSVLMLDENNIVDIPDVLLSDCRVLFGLSIKKNPISMTSIASKPSYNDFHSRRLHHFKWQIESGSMDRDQLLVTDGY
jgi:Leucine-rich repeat (LRR) protein